MRKALLAIALLAAPLSAQAQGIPIQDLPLATTPLSSSDLFAVTQGNVFHKLPGTSLGLAAGLGTMSTQNANNVTITGGSITGGVIVGNIMGHASLDLTIANNLSDVASASTSATNLGLGSASAVGFASLTLTSNPVYAVSGATTNGHCVEFGTGSILTDTGAACSSGGGGGSVTSVGLTVPGSSILGLTGSPITTAGTIGLTTTGTSGGIPYFSSTSQLSSSAALAANAIVLGKGAGVAPATTTTGTGVVTAIGNATNGTGGLVTFNGNIGTTATGHASLDLALTGGAMTGTITSNVLSTLTATTSSSLGPQITLINEAADTSNPYLILQKGRAGGTTTLSGDTLGAIDFQGFGSGNATAQGPLIAAIMTGAAGTTFVPSDLVFSTATSAALNEQMRITSAGNISIAGNISSVGAITSSGLVALSGHFSQTITGSAGSGNGAVNLAYADSGGISGQYQPFALNFNDNLDNTTDDFDDGLVSVLVVNPANNPTARGGRQALVGAVFLRNPTGSHNNRNYVGVEAAGQADSGDGGTGGSPLGAVFGLGFSGVAGAGAANLLNITGAEGNVSALNNSVYYKSVLQLDNNQGDLYRGTHYDAILSISAQSNSLPNGGWLNGILFSQANGAKPVGTDGTLIATQDSATVFSFIDFSSYTCSGGLAIHTPGFEVSCAGDIQGGYISGINNSMGAYPTSQATSFLIGDNFSGGAGEVNFWNTQNNAGGFSFYQKTGASVATLVAIINGSGNTSVAGSMQVGNLVGSGSRPVCVTSAGVLEAGTLAAGLVTCP